MLARYVTALSLLLLAKGADAQCVARNNQTASHRTVRLVVNTNGMPATVQEGIAEGLEAWNSDACNIGGNDFPLFQTAGDADVTLPISFNPDVSPGACATITQRSATGSASEITLYSRRRYPEGIFECFPNSAVVADAVAHELGHYLGLADAGVNCVGSIMGPQPYSVLNGQIFYDSSAQVQPAECSAADDINSLPLENLEETPPPPPDGNTDPGPGAVDCCTSPIVIDLARNGFGLTDLDGGARFDLNADGDAERTSWTRASGDDSFLALDRNGNGWIDDGTELFGDATPQPSSGTPNGYLALAVYDSLAEGGNGDGWITSADRVFRELRIWTDVDHDGVSQISEIATLPAQGVTAISLRYVESRRRDRHGNQFRYWSRIDLAGRRPSFTFSVDVFFLTAED